LVAESFDTTRQSWEVSAQTRPPIAATVASTAVEAQRPVPPKTALELIGTSIAADRRVAYLREAAGERSWTVRNGDRIDGMLVVSIEPDRISLHAGDRTDDLVIVASVAALPATARGPMGSEVGPPASFGRSTSAGVAASSELPMPTSDSASNDDASVAQPPPLPLPVRSAPVAPTVAEGGPKPTLNSVEPAFDPRTQAGESASADEASDPRN
jgi:hypothetical protein